MINHGFEMPFDPFKGNFNRKTTQCTLLSLLQEQNYTDFAEILKSSDFTNFNVHHFYDEPENGTLLDIACRSKGNCRFVKILILYNAKVNFVNPKRGKAPIHEAIECNDIETIKILCRESISSSECDLFNDFQREGCDINVTDKYGRNAVMLAAYFARSEILSVLLKNNQLSLEPVVEKTALHSLVDGWMEIGQKEGTEDENNKYYQCLECIFKQTPRDELHELLDYIESQSMYYANENEIDRDEFFKTYLKPRIEKYKIVETPHLARNRSSKSSRAHRDTNPPENSPSPSLHSTLLFLLQNKNLKNFEETLTSDPSTVHHFYPKEEGTLLDVACRSPGFSQFVDILLKQPQIDINAINEQTGKAPIHEAVQKSDSRTLRCLLRNINCDVNLICAKGYTPLDYVAIHKRVDFIDILFDFGARKPESCPSLSEQWAAVLKMQKIVAQYTPIMRAARYGNYQTFRKLIEEESASIEPTIDGKTVMHMVLDGIMAFKYQTSIGRLQRKHFAAGKNDFDCEKDTLVRPQNFTLFENEQRDHYELLKYFLRGLDQLQYVNYTDRDGNTALHYAVLWEDLVITEALLQAGAHTCIPNKNGTVPLKSLTSQQLEKYLDRCIWSSKKYPLEHSDYSITFDYSTLFSVCRNGTLGRYADADRRQISISDEDKQSDIELGRIKVDDEAVYSRSADVEIRLASRVGQQITREIEPILIMYNEPELRPFLNHPLVRSYLDIKWSIVGKYFKYNFALYFVYWSSLSLFLYFAFNEPTPGLPSKRFGASNATSVGKNDDRIILPKSYDEIWRIFILLLCGLLILRELFQFYVLPMMYVKSLENWLEMGLFVSTFVLLSTFEHPSDRLTAFIILASWLELVMLIGRHPWYSTHIEMFKTVAYNFFKFLLLYFIMIVAFAFSFYVLFRDRCQELGKSDCDKPSRFPSLSMSIFKTLIMLSGEYDSSSILFNEKIDIGHLFFILFVILISIVLLNLLNGLAVGDTQKIVNEAEMVGALSRVKFIQHVECMAELDPIQCLNSLDELVQYLYNLRPWRKRSPLEGKRERVDFQTKISLKYYLGRYFIKVFPKERRSDSKKVKIKRKIIDDAVKIVLRRNQRQENIDDDEFLRRKRKMMKNRGNFQSVSFRT